MWLTSWPDGAANKSLSHTYEWWQRHDARCCRILWNVCLEKVIFEGTGAAETHQGDQLCAHSPQQFSTSADETGAATPPQTAASYSPTVFSSPPHGSKWSGRFAHSISFSASFAPCPTAHRRGHLNGCHVTPFNDSFRDCNCSCVNTEQSLLDCCGPLYITVLQSVCIYELGCRPEAFSARTQ